MPDENMKKGGTPPAEDAADASSTGVGLTHGKSRDGVPTENTANKDNTVGSGGKLPGSMNKAALEAELVKSLSREDKIALLKSAMGLGQAPELQKSADEVVTWGDLRKFGQDLTGQIVSELRKGFGGAELQKSGLTPLEAGAAPPKPELVKMEQDPTYQQGRTDNPEGGSELQKGLDFESPVQYAHDGGVLKAGRVPTMAELARMPLGEFNE